MFESDDPAEVLAAVAATDFAALAPEDLGASRIDAIAALERVVRVAQARIVEQVDGLYRDRLTHIPFGHGDQSLSVTGEVALARGVSPSAGATLFTLMMGLRALPAVRAAFGRGAISEATARAIVRETVNLDDDDAIIVDGELSDQVADLTPRRAAAVAREAVIRVDAEAAEERARAARAEQYVSYHPEPDGVGTLIVRGPAEQLLAAHQSLQAWADGLRSADDERTSGQIMVDTLTERVTGVAHADGIDVNLSIVMPVEAFTTDDVSAELLGHGPIPATLAEELATRAHQTWYRRLFTDPAGDLVGLDRRRRRFTGNLATWVRTRDRNRCRQPYCSCRIRDIDHITPYRAGGETTGDNAQGMCRRSHQLKELPGWRVRRQFDGGVAWTTPTGHTYTSPAPTFHRRT